MPCLARRAWSILGTVSLVTLALASACGTDPEPMALDTSFELLEGFQYDTGKLPASGPVQVSLVLSGGAVAKVHLPAIASEDSGDAALHAAGPGTIEVSGGFKLDGTLKVDQSGLPGYDGDIPGLADINLPLSGSAPIADFAIGKPASVSAAITPGDLPPIPLPGGVPGHLQLSIAEGSSIDVALEGTCAGVDDGKAEYQGAAVRSGTINIGIAVDLEIPFTGTQTIDIATVAVPLPESSYEVAASAEDVALEAAPEGSSAAPACASPEEEGTGSGGGTGEGGAGGGQTSSTSSGTVAECSDDTGCDAGQACNSQGLCKPLTEHCINKTVVVGDMELVAGDREFGGNGPNVTLLITPSVVDSEIAFDISLHMQEIGSDQSTGTRMGQISFPAAVDSVHDVGAILEYTDDNTEMDYFAGVGAYLEVRCMGDTAGGSDICIGSDCSYCEIDIGCVPVTTP